jgi:WXG100 family type VII secretion target
MAEKTELNYDQLQGFIKAFETEAEEILNLTKQTHSHVDHLHGGEWIGKGADKFFSEMHSDILPALNRLVQALNTASQTTRQIAEIFNSAEEETQGYFNSLAE